MKSFGSSSSDVDGMAPAVLPSLPETFDQAQVWLFERGYDHIESEVTPWYASVFVWRSFNRVEGIASSGQTFEAALTNVCDRVHRRDSSQRTGEATGVTRVSTGDEVK